jgi:hypothetical protein
VTIGPLPSDARPAETRTREPMPTAPPMRGGWRHNPAVIAISHAALTALLASEAFADDSGWRWLLAVLACLMGVGSTFEARNALKSRRLLRRAVPG